VVVCTKDRYSDLFETLRSLALVSVPRSWNVEWLLVDNGSTDGTANLTPDRMPGGPWRIVREPHPGLSRARNRALAEARGDILLFTDDDVRAPRDWLSRMVVPIVESAGDAVCGGVRLADHLQTAWLTERHRSWLACTETINPDRPDRLVGANMSFHRRVLSKVPEFDPSLGAGALGFHEESLFSWQLAAAGFRIAGALDCQVEHHPSPERITWLAFVNAAHRMGRSSAYVDYHWRHQPADIRLIDLWRGQLMLRARLALRHRERRDAVAPWWAIGAVSKVSYLRQMLYEQGRSRRYDRAVASCEETSHGWPCGSSG
jgi:glycosyltransferase involved in cell wall biosynthesis